MGSTHPELTPLAQLGKALGYSVEDLKANRAGKVSPRQRQQIWRRFYSALLSWWLLLLVPILIGWVLVSWNGGKSPGTVIVSSSAVVGYLTGLLLSGFYIFVNHTALLSVIDMLRGRIQTVSGPVERFGQYIYVSNYRFLLESKTLDLIQSKLSYTFYILPGARHILSIEFAE